MRNPQRIVGNLVLTVVSVACVLGLFELGL